MTRNELKNQLRPLITIPIVKIGESPKPPYEQMVPIMQVWIDSNKDKPIPELLETWDCVIVELFDEFHIVH